MTFRPELVVATFSDDDHTTTTFKYDGKIYTLISSANSSEGYYVCPDGTILEWNPMDGSLYAELTDFFNRHELWSVS